MRKLMRRMVLTAILGATTVSACGGPERSAAPTTEPTSPAATSSSIDKPISPTTTLAELEGSPVPPTPVAAQSSPPTDPALVTTPPGTTLLSDVGGTYESAVVAESVDNPAFDAMEREITAKMREAGLPGASLLVVQRGTVVEQEAWLGYSLETVVPIASASKWLSAATIMTLVDDGTLTLDDPISSYVTELGRSKAGKITLRQLLSFTSGLIADEKVPEMSDGSVTIQQAARALISKGLVHPPGEAFRYGAQHLHVAGALAEIVTGQSFVELFEERIATPLGMVQTRFLHAGDPVRLDVTHPSPAGSAISTLGDYGRFLEMIVHDGVAPNGEQILSAAALSEMQRNHTETVRYASASSFRMETKDPYGLGEWIDWTYPDGRAMVLSSDGAFGFRPWIDRQNDLFGVYMIDDRGQGYSEGDPRASAGDEKKVHTSGLWILEMVAEALGGSLPKNAYPHRS